jgi:hypothetical protein
MQSAFQPLISALRGTMPSIKGNKNMKADREFFLICLWE